MVLFATRAVQAVFCNVVNSLATGHGALMSIRFEKGRSPAVRSSESSSAQTRRELDILLRDLANPSSHTITSGQPLVTVRDNTMGIFYLFEPSVGETGRGISRTRHACITGALSRLISINNHDLSHSFATFLPVSTSEILSSILDLLFLL